MTLRLITHFLSQIQSHIIVAKVKLSKPHPCEAYPGIAEGKLRYRFNYDIGDGDRYVKDICLMCITGNVCMH